MAGRTEISVELWLTVQEYGPVTGLGVDALAGCPAGHPVFAAVCSGNARYLPTFLACGFRLLGSEVLLAPGVPSGER